MSVCVCAYVCVRVCVYVCVRRCVCVCARWKEGDLDGTIEYSMQEWSSPTAEHRLAQFAPKGNSTVQHATAQQCIEVAMQQRKSCNNVACSGMGQQRIAGQHAVLQQRALHFRCIRRQDAFGNEPPAVFPPFHIRAGTRPTSAPGLGPHPRRDSGAFDEALRTVLHRIGAYTADRPSPVRPRSRPPHPSVLCVRAVRSLRRSRVISAPMRRGCRVGYGRGALRQLASGAVASLRAARSAVHAVAAHCPLPADF